MFFKNSPSIICAISERVSEMKASESESATIHASISDGIPKNISNGKVGAIS